VNLRADAILKEHGWLPTTVLTAAMLCDITGVVDESLRLLRSYMSYDYRGGWHTGQRLPKDTELVTRSAGVFVFQTDDLTPWLAPLAALEVHGIGERTVEGFGEVRTRQHSHRERCGGCMEFTPQVGQHAHGGKPVPQFAERRHGDHQCRCHH